jgi:hypothetical protein
MMPERTIFKYFVQMARGLAHMHSERIMHRGTIVSIVEIWPSVKKKLGFDLERKISTNEMILSQAPIIDANELSEV